MPHPTPDEPSEFATTDAAIALASPMLCFALHSRSRAGIRPPDPRWDVSGDGSITSLDALRILQAAAGGIAVG